MERERETNEMKWSEVKWSEDENGRNHTLRHTPTSIDKEVKKIVKSHRIYVTIESIIYKLRIEFNTQTLRLYLFSSRSKGIFTKKKMKERNETQTKEKEVWKRKWCVSVCVHWKSIRQWRKKEVLRAKMKQKQEKTLWIL